VCWKVTMGDTLMVPISASEVSKDWICQIVANALGLDSAKDCKVSEFRAQDHQESGYLSSIFQAGVTFQQNGQEHLQKVRSFV